jgi:hypothetical protein
MSLAAFTENALVGVSTASGDVGPSALLELFGRFLGRGFTFVFQHACLGGG